MEPTSDAPNASQATKLDKKEKKTTQKKDQKQTEGEKEINEYRGCDKHTLHFISMQLHCQTQINTIFNLFSIKSLNNEIFKTNVMFNAG